MSKILPALNHFGLTVHSLRETLDFYKKITTVEVYEEKVRITGEGVGEVIQVEKPDYDSCLVRIGGANFELIEHFSSKGGSAVGKHNEIGGIHLAFMVKDIDYVYDKLKELGIETTYDGPYTAENLGGYRTLFFKDINGISVEVGQI